MPVSKTWPAVALVILDGWGIAPPGPGNAVDLAQTPTMDGLLAKYPNTQLKASGLAVGLPDGQMGNSEVGHLNLGAGAIVNQDLTRINAAVADGTLGDHEALQLAVDGFSRIHLIGLVSDGGVHSSQEHLYALLRMIAARAPEAEVVVHAFTDGRDTSPQGGAKYLAELQEVCDETGARIGSVIGRYLAMDRDNRSERTQAAVDLLVNGTGEFHSASAVEATIQSYERDPRGDEFIAPTTIGDLESTIRPQDSVIAFNFRPDRMRQITAAIAPTVARYTCLTEYDERWEWPVAFPPARPATTLTKVIADLGLHQLHVAETEKYPHVTYFFAGGEEQPEPGEQREVVPSPRDVPTYDLKPQMSAHEAADAFCKHWREESPAFGIINFANADMVGHTGVIPAAIAAVETVDGCLAQVVECVQQSGGVLIVTADHGNADEMLEPDGSPDTAHSLNPVPLVVTDDSIPSLRGGGVLADVAPTALDLLGLQQPVEMTGRSLVER